MEPRITFSLHYVQLDLGAAYSVDKLKVFHYAADGRTYHQTKTQVSTDGVSWTTIFDSAVSGEYAETSAGKTHTFTARSVRYVRDYLNGSTSNTGDHWVESEVYGSRTMAYLGNYYEWDASASTPTKYYYAGAERVAMRTGTGTGTSGLKWLIDDHLGSTAITADGAAGSKLSELRYKPWGEIRYASQPTMTSLRYTGQRMEGIGLYDYGARWFDASLGRFIQADTIVPNLGDPQAWDRYAYVNNNAVKFVDPTGHMVDQGGGGGAFSMGEEWWMKRQETIKKKESSPSKMNRPDAKLISGNVTIGAFAPFLVFGYDVVTTDNEIGFFSTLAVGPGLGGDTASIINRENEDRTGIWPQISAGVVYGNVYGNSLRENVKEYRGTSLIAGGSWDLITSEHFTSIDPKTGYPDYNVSGEATGITVGSNLVFPWEVHTYYSRATYNPYMSNFITSLVSGAKGTSL